MVSITILAHCAAEWPARVRACPTPLAPRSIYAPATSIPHHPFQHLCGGRILFPAGPLGSSDQSSQCVHLVHLSIQVSSVFSQSSESCSRKGSQAGTRARQKREKEPTTAPSRLGPGASCRLSRYCHNHTLRLVSPGPGLGLRSGFEPPDLDRPGRLPQGSGRVCRVAVGFR